MSGAGTSRYGGELDFAVAAAEHAGRVVLSHYQTAFGVEAKTDGSPVTVADREAERTLRDLIEARFPNDGILGEEHGPARAESERCWVIDPIDGTKTFVRGVPLFGVLVALVENGTPGVGVVHFPALAETVAAARGGGCWWNGRPARVSTVDRLDRALVLTTSVELDEEHGRGEGWHRLRARAGMARTWSDCYGYALVATGRAEAMADPIMAPWDIAALVPIVEEAGGVFTSWDGGPAYPATSAVATNAALAAEVRQLLGAVP
jgi:histidinol phosphatase-like enzyme (inositol monophosphatase family)